MKQEQNRQRPDMNPATQCHSLKLVNDKFDVKGGEIHSIMCFFFYRGVLRIKERILRTYKYPNKYRKNKDIMVVLTIDAANTYKLMQSMGISSEEALLKFLASEFEAPIPPSLNDVAIYLSKKEIPFDRMLFA